MQQLPADLVQKGDCVVGTVQGGLKQWVPIFTVTQVCFAACQPLMFTARPDAAALMQCLLPHLHSHPGALCCLPATASHSQAYLLKQLL